MNFSFFFSLSVRSGHSNERLFLRDFVSCTAGSSGGRLARWLQPDSFVDPSKCEALYSKDDMKCGCPAIITVHTRDQYGDIVHVPNLKVCTRDIVIVNRFDHIIVIRFKYLTVPL